MSKILAAKEICERSLRMIGAFPITESAADGEHLREAMTWLDLIMAEVAGSTILFNLVPATISQPLTAGVSTYALNNTLGAQLPVDGLQFPVEAFLVTTPSSGVPIRCPIPIVHRDEFKQPENGALTGPPVMIHIDRLPNPTMLIYPTPAPTDVNNYSIELDVQTYAPNVAPAGVTGTQPDGSIVTKFRQAWQRFLVSQLAHDLGSGPIFKLPEASLNRFGAMAKGARTKLEAFENREHETVPPICDSSESYDYPCDYDNDRRYH